MSLDKALSIIASDTYLTETKPRRKIFRVNQRAARILMRAVAPDPAQGWGLLHTLDRLSLYGWMLVGIYEDFCLKDIEWFIGAILVQDIALQRFSKGMIAHARNYR